MQDSINQVSPPVPAQLEAPPHLAALEAPRASQARSPASLFSAGREGAFRAMRGQQERLASRLDQAVASVHRAASRYEGQQDWLAGAIHRGAAELGKAAASVRNKDLDEFIEEFGRFARQNRAIIAGASLIAGFAAARLGKLAFAAAGGQGGRATMATAHG